MSPPEEAQSSYTVPFFIDGKETTPSKTFDVVSPATGESVHKCSGATAEDADAAVASASKAFGAWRKVTPARRRDMFLKTAEVMERRREELAGYLVAETGGTLHWANFNLNLAIEIIKDVAGRVATLQGLMSTTADPGISAMVLKEPFGVVLAAAPWNAPYILGVRAVSYPLAAGNTVVLKASEKAPRVMWGIVSCFHEAGLPEGVLNMIMHQPADAAAVTTALIANPEVKKINFTGSTAVGRIIAKLAGEHLKPVLLELGGKAPAIVWHDADLDNAAKQCTLGAFLHGGQICMSTERIIVHRDVREEFEKKLLDTVEAIFPSSGEAPVLISADAVENNKKLVQDALGKGATIAGDKTKTGEYSGTRMRPIVISGVTTDMNIYKTESFGPTVSLLEVDSEEEALRIANDTEYGLTSAVFTKDLTRGLRFAREIESGAVHINNMTVHDEPMLLHGGVKASGFGRFNATALDEWVRTKTVTFPN